jgi:RIO kinase 1
MKDYKPEKRRKDKANTATKDKVLDPKTVNILKNLEKRGKLKNLSSSVSSGKEANIYTAKCSNSLISKFIQPIAQEPDIFVDVALKIYKTSTMIFKDRSKYIINEKRFANFCTSNSRKLIKLWAEKEVRNLKRLNKVGIPSPKPLYLKRTILILEMIGNDKPAPRLKDAIIEDWKDAYEQCINIIRDMYKKARLIHADFSEYNLIYHNKKVYVIDVGQSIETNHDNSNGLLIMDICNINDFFKKQNVETYSEILLFEEITGLKVPTYLKSGRLGKDSFIPTRIDEIVNPEDISLFIEDFKGLKIVNPIAGDAIRECNSQSYDESEYEGSEYSDDASEKESDEVTNDEEVNNDDASEKESDEVTNDEEVNNDDASEKESEEVTNDDDVCSESISSSENASVDIDGIDDGIDDNIKAQDDKKTKPCYDPKELLADPSKINLFCRRVRLKNAEITVEEEKIINRERRAIVKEMNRERRTNKSIKKEEYAKKKKLRARAR